MAWLRVIAAAMALFLCGYAAEAGAARKPKVLYLHSDGSFPQGVSDVVGNLQGSGVFEQVDAWDGGAATPTLTQLKAYDAVLLTNVGPWADRVALGNVMSQYVDAGYGVVQSIFTAGGVGGSNLGGTWSGAYNCITFGPSTNGAATLGTIAVPNHATMIGVGSFNGGASSFRPSGTALTAGATLIASWSDGKPLVAVGPKINRADIGFYPPSANAFGSYWDPATDGTKLLVNALLYTIRPTVLVVHSMIASEANDVQSKLSSTGSLGGVDLFDAAAATPTLAQLKRYDAIMVTNALSWSNRTALGNVVADYVDWGGGVVQTVFANGGIPNSDLGGRFTGDYTIIPFAASTNGPTSALGAVTYPNHPIMAGVVSFSGGPGSYRPTPTGLVAGGLKIAQWADGKTLVATSMRRANRADLGFYPPSSSAGSFYWTGDGAKLMANALVYVCRPYVACVAADSQRADVPAKLIASRRFSGVDLFDATLPTPSLATLLPYNAVMTWSNSAYNNTTTLGNTLADYVDAGGAGVTALWGNALSGAGTPQGRWVTQGYDIAPTASLTGYLSNPQAFLGAILEPNNPVARFVRKFDGGVNSFRMNSVVLLRGRAIMNWSDGKTLASVHNFRKRVDIGFWPPSNSSTNGWNRLTDGTWITANAIEYAVRHAPCPGDLNGDGQVDDDDFVIFVVYYDALVDPRGDLNGDGLTEDNDFVIFVSGYDALVCP